MGIKEKQLLRMKEWKMEDEKDQKALTDLITSFENAKDTIGKQKAVIKTLTYLLPALKKELQKQEFVSQLKKVRGRKPSEVKEEVKEAEASDFLITCGMFEPMNSDKIEDLYKKGLI